MSEARRFLGHPDVRHGSVDAAQQGCRCRRCTETAADYAEAIRMDHLRGGNRAAIVRARNPQRAAGVVSGVASARRLRALVTIGYAPNYLASRLGLLSAEVMDVLFLQRRGTIQRWKAANIEGLYDELWDQPATGPTAERARIVARREGWYPPLSWDDDDIGDLMARPSGAADPQPGDALYMPWADLERLMDEGTPFSEVMQRAGYRDVASLKKRLHNHDRRDLLAKIPGHTRLYPDGYRKAHAQVPA